jgi:rod shape-determining protein MreC
MDAPLISRYRSTLLLVVVIAVQFVLLAYQVKSEGNVRVIRMWAVTAVTPIANIAELVRSNVTGFFTNYVSLRDVRNENRHMKTELGALKLENQFLQSELNTADRAKALASFQVRTPSKMIAARMIGAAGGPSNNVVFLDRGTTAGVQKGMAVVTPDGIVGEVVGSFPTASQAVLVTDPGFAAGVISQKTKVRGVAKGIGGGRCKVDFVPNEENVEVGELFYTSGDDRVFPKGLPVGRVTVSKPGGSLREIFLDPTGLQSGPEEVLIIVQGVHQPIPDDETMATQVYMGPPSDTAKESSARTNTLETDADRLREKYRQIGVAQNHVYGTGAIPNFNQKLVSTPTQGAAKPASSGMNDARSAPAKIVAPPLPERVRPVGSPLASPKSSRPAKSAERVLIAPRTGTATQPRIGLPTRPPVTGAPATPLSGTGFNSTADQKKAVAPPSTFGNTIVPAPKTPVLRTVPPPPEANQ